MCIFLSYQLTTLPEVSVGHETLSQRTDETDQAYEDLLVVFMFILLLFTYALVCF